MNKYIKEHETFIINLLSSDDDIDWLKIREYHKTKIEFLQQERLIHLIVTLGFAFLLICSLVISWLYPIAALLLLDLLLAILILFYTVHYYRLENGVQRWYRLYDDICDKID